MYQNLILAFSGLGLFLYAMLLMEESMKKLAGRSFKKIIQNSTKTVLKSIFIGVLATAVLQSSSLVSLIVLSLVGAGFVNLKSGIGVIFGANIGTTFTSWVVAIFGFKLNIESFALPLIGVGSFLLLFFIENKKISTLAKLILALGLLFLGLSYMKESMEVFAQNFDLKEYASYGTFAMVAVGFVLTAVIQSSSAATAIFLTALYSGIITFDMGAALVIGANIGTTVTAMLGSIGGTPDKKRIAAAHLIFNLATGVLALILLPYLSRFILEYLALKDDLTTALALFHTIFNFLGVLLFSPFISSLAKYLNTLFTKTKTPIAHYITKVPTDIPEVALEALKNESLHLYKNTLEFCLFIINIRPKDVMVEKLKTKEILEKNSDILDINYSRLYKNLKKLEIMIISYANDLKSKELKEDEVKKIGEITEAVDKMMFASKTFKDIKEDMDRFALSLNEYEYSIYQHFRYSVAKLFKNIMRVIEGEKSRVADIVRIYNEISEDNKNAIFFIAQRIKEYDIAQESAATILNVNRAIFFASKNLIESANRLFLPMIDLTENGFENSKKAA
ncbi:Na/Pi cotransporter family protein [Nitrosophilus labii]|uniref:Na/Pi cotransporter family protein n=1 Tax=Nitrosophilus labii TaxID=2706014 RepID=UPI001656BAF9|nr:Na/Pi symporter [Nitrosophilus labii]